jgi:hypothetical protein
MQGFNPTDIILKALSQYWWLFLLFIAFLFFLQFLKSAKFKGKIAEKTTSLGMTFKLDPKEYTIFNNLIIKDSRGQTQIDHVIVSKYGIFVIEVKNYNGWIFGNENDEYWTQVVFKKKNKFQNPLRQNYRHFMALSEYLGLGKEFFHIVFFPGDVEFKTDLPANVIKSNLTGYIKSFDKQILNEKDVEKIKQKLSLIK